MTWGFIIMGSDLDDHLCCLIVLVQILEQSVNRNEPWSDFSLSLGI